MIQKHNMIGSLAVPSRRSIVQRMTKFILLLLILVVLCLSTLPKRNQETHKSTYHGFAFAFSDNIFGSQHYHHHHRRRHHPASFMFQKPNQISQSTIDHRDRNIPPHRLSRHSSSSNSYDNNEKVSSSRIPGTSKDFDVTQQYKVPSFPILDHFHEGIELLSTKLDVPPTKLDRLQLTSQNITLPIALVLLDSIKYPTLSKARKACRKGNIVIQRQSTTHNTHVSSSSATTRTNFSNRGNVGDRVYPGDIIGQQIRKSHNGEYSTFVSKYVEKLTFELPVIYQDDYFAIVNKPAGITVYAESGGGRNVRFALPYVLTPPSSSLSTTTITNDDNDNVENNSSHPTQPNEENDRYGSSDNDNIVLRRPETCHRLDKPTSGLLVVAKTKSAAKYLSMQFEKRLVQKTYTAIVDGILPYSTTMANNDDDDATSSSSAPGISAPIMTTMTIAEGQSLSSLWPNAEEPEGPTFFNTSLSPIGWNLAQTMLEGKEAVTFWRSLGRYSSIKAMNQTLTLVELKPKTGRYHQLRRQMAWMYNCPIIGDTIYGHEYNKNNNNATTRSEAEKREHARWKRGLMLCSNRISIMHPYYNTKLGRIEWEQLQQEQKSKKYKNDDGSSFCLHQSKDDGNVWVTAEIQIPNKFEKYLRAESNRYHYANTTTNKKGG